MSSPKKTTVVDTSVWLEIAAGGSRAKKYESLIATRHCAIPTICHLEIYEWTKSKLDEADALEFIGALSIHDSLDLTRDIALLAGDLAIEFKLGWADAVVLAHARSLRAEILSLEPALSTWVSSPAGRSP